MNRITRFFELPIGWFIFLGLLLRIGAYLILGDPHFPDSEIYVQGGQELFKTGWMQNHIYMPLYPILTFLTGGRTGAIALDILFSTATIVLVDRLGVILSGSARAGKVAAFFTAIYPFFIFYSFSVLTESSYLFFLLLTFYLLYRKSYTLGSAVAALSLLIKPVGELITPILLVLFCVVVHREGLKKCTRVLLVYFAFYLVCLAPWWVHNYTKFDQRFVRLTLADGIVLYSGNNPLNQTGGGVVRPDGSMDMDLTQFDSIADPIERNDAMKASAITYIRENPGRFIEMIGMKFIRFWRLWPYADQYAGLKYVVISLLSYGSILFLAMLTLVGFRKEDFVKCMPIFAYIAYLTAIHCVTIASIRYRLPIEPFLIIFAGMGIGKFLSARDHSQSMNRY